ncbi:DnaD domain protein [Lysinibacillus capsici]|uniref:DnaD domain protein n=1 Tax=Lysinibacillus capsici TaxID=2115968 RepID=UPI002899650B|nr:DnaD domain protein [Lysinibacillus capsici]
MAKYRNVHTTFWDDGFVLDLTPEEKYFYLYLMTNGNTTQCGIYELPYRVIEMHTGYNRETVQKLLQRFVEYGKITYNESTKEIMLNNWAKYNFINSPKVKKCIEKELLAVKHIPFVRSYVTSLEQLGYRIDTVSILLEEKCEPKVPNTSNGEGSIPYQYPIDTPSIDYGEEREEEREKEEEKEEEGEEKKVGHSINPFLEIKNFFDSTIRISNFTDHKKMDMLLEFYPDYLLIIEAIKVTADNGKSNIEYVEGILKNWAIEKGINTYADWQLKEAKPNGIAKGHNANKQISANSKVHAGTGIDAFYEQLERDKQAWGG